MGASSSSQNSSEIGDEVFRFAETFLQIDDVNDLEKITGMVLNSAGNDANELYNLLKNDRDELERRVRESARAIEQCSDSAKSHNKDVKSRSFIDTGKRREELISHFQRLYPAIDSSKVADKLLKLNEKELNYVISTPSELKSFIKACSLDTDEGDDVKNGPTSGILDTVDHIEKLKQEHLEELSKPEICEADVEKLIGNHLFKRVSLLHPSKASFLTGILLGMERDVILQLLVSAPTLHVNIANVIKELVGNNKLSKRDIALMQEELGDLIYSVVEKDMEQETACQVTGMLLEMDLVCLHEVLADEFLFRKCIKESLNACKSKS